MNKPETRAAKLMLELKRGQFDPLEELLKLYRKSPDLKDSDRMKICQDLMTFVYPKLKAMEFDTKGGQPLVLNIDLSGTPKAAPVAEAA